MAKITRDEIVEAISASLVEFGYPDAKPPLISKIYDAFKSGERGKDLPHGVIGRFAESQLQELADALGGNLP